MKNKTIGEFFDSVVDTVKKELKEGKEGYNKTKDKINASSKNRKNKNVVDDVEYTVDGKAPDEPDINFTFGEGYTNPGAANIAMGVAGQNARNGMGHSGIHGFIRQNPILSVAGAAGTGMIIGEEGTEADMRHHMMGMGR